MSFQSHKEQKGDDEARRQLSRQMDEARLERQQRFMTDQWAQPSPYAPTGMTPADHVQWRNEFKGHDDKSEYWETQDDPRRALLRAQQQQLMQNHPPSYPPPAELPHRYPPSYYSDGGKFGSDDLELTPMQARPPAGGAKRQAPWHATTHDTSFSVRPLNRQRHDDDAPSY